MDSEALQKRVTDSGDPITNSGHGVESQKTLMVITKELLPSAITGQLC